MKTRQKSVRVFEFEIDKPDEFIAFIKKNSVLLLEYLLLLKGNVDDAVKSELSALGLCFLEINNCNLTLKDTKKESVLVSAQTQAVENKTKIFNRPIRSGEEIESDADLIIFGRINSGSRVYGRGNIAIFGEIDGLVVCDGSLLMIKKIAQGSVVFNGELLDKTIFDGSKLRRVYMANSALCIEEI